MGFRHIKGIGCAEREKIETATRQGPFASMEDFCKRTRLNEKSLETLAEAGAFEGISATRRSAIWESRGVSWNSERLLPIERFEKKLEFDELDDFETIAWDYRSSSHSTRGHPLAPLRNSLRAMGIPDAQSIATLGNGSPVRYAGLVICRQRPGTASGVTFMTLEDETGFVNLVLWNQVFQSHVVLVKTSRFLGVTGKIQAEQGVVHVIAESLWTPRLHVQPELVRSRDFH
jgi:error-prone DNA polymerase